MKGQINTDSRFDKAKDALVEKIKSSTKFEEHPTFWNLFTQNWMMISIPTNGFLNCQPSATLVTIGDMAYPISDFADYTKKNTKIRLKHDVSNQRVKWWMNCIKHILQIKYWIWRKVTTKIPWFQGSLWIWRGIYYLKPLGSMFGIKQNQDTVGLESFMKWIRPITIGMSKPMSFIIPFIWVINLWLKKFQTLHLKRLGKVNAGLIKRECGYDYRITIW